MLKLLYNSQNNHLEKLLRGVILEVRLPKHYDSVTTTRLKGSIAKRGL